MPTAATTSRQSAAVSASEKKVVRREFRRRRKNLRGAERKRAEREIVRRMLAYARKGKRIGVYLPVGSEAGIAAFADKALLRGVRVYLPYIEPGKKRLWFTPFAPGQHSERPARSRPDIPQFAGKKIRAHCLDILFMPLLAVDAQGFRLGQGGGYYDTTLAHTRHRLQPKRIGVGFACQKTDTVPVEAHDMPLHAFVCETGCTRFSPHRKTTSAAIQS